MFSGAGKGLRLRGLLTPPLFLPERQTRENPCGYAFFWGSTWSTTFRDISCATIPLRRAVLAPAASGCVSRVPMTCILPSKEDRTQGAVFSCCGTFGVSRHGIARPRAKSGTWTCLGDAYRGVKSKTRAHPQRECAEKQGGDAGTCSDMEGQDLRRDIFAVFPDSRLPCAVHLAFAYSGNLYRNPCGRTKNPDIFWPFAKQWLRGLPCYEARALPSRRVAQGDGDSAPACLS